MKTPPLSNATRLVSLLLFASVVISRSDENWPEFRGPDSRGLPAQGANPPVEWSARKNIAWKADVPGLGWSSPIVWGGKIFLTSAARVAGDEQPQMGL